MKAILLTGAGPVRADRHRRAGETRTRRGAGARPPRRHLRHRHQRLPRQDAVLQLPAHPRPRTGRRGAGGRPRRGQRPAGRPLLHRAVHELPALLRLPARRRQLLRKPASARRPHRRRLAAAFRAAGPQAAPVEAADARPAGPGRDARHRLSRRQPRRPEGRRKRARRRRRADRPVRHRVREADRGDHHRPRPEPAAPRLLQAADGRPSHRPLRRRSRSLGGAEGLDRRRPLPGRLRRDGQPQVDVQRLQLRRPHRPAGVRRHRRQRRARSPTRCSTAGK